jgi:hypothetical protein
MSDDIKLCQVNTGYVMLGQDGACFFQGRSFLYRLRQVTSC